MFERLIQGGQAVDVTRVEFEILENRRFRWTAWSGSQRLFSQTGNCLDREDVAGTLQATSVFIRGMALGGSHGEEENGEETGFDAKESRAPDRLG